MIGQGVEVLGKPSEQYHKDIFPEGAIPQLPGFPGRTFSASWLRAALASSPAEAENDSVDESSTPLRMGTAAHNITLRDDDANFVIIDADNWRTKAAKEQRDAALAAGQAPILRSEFENTILPMRDAFTASGLGDYILTPDARRECSIYFSGWTGLPCRMRTDIMPTDDMLRRGIGQVDYKTTSVSFGKFTRSFFWDRGGALRVAHYSLGKLAQSGVLPNYWLLIQSKNPPYAMQLRQINVGHAVRRWIEASGQPMPIDANTALTVDNCPQYWDGAADSVSDYEAVIRIFIHGVQLWKKGCEVARACMEAREYPMPTTFSMLGASAADIVKSFGAFQGVNVTENEGAMDFQPHGFSPDPTTGMLTINPNTPTWTKREGQTDEQDEGTTAPGHGTGHDAPQPDGPGTHGSQAARPALGDAPTGQGEAPAGVPAAAGPAADSAGPAAGTAGAFDIGGF